MKLRIIVIAAMVALILSTGLASPAAGPAHRVAWADASWAGAYSTMEELCMGADIIAVGTVTAIEQVTNRTTAGGSVLYFTDFAFTVAQALKGPGNLSEVVIHQTGAPGEWELQSDPLFNLGEQYVVFVDGEEGRYATIGGPQGRFPIIEDEVFSMLYVLYPDLMDYEPEEVAEYSDPSDWLLFYLDIKGIDKQTFADWVTDTMECGVNGYVGANIPPYGTFPLQGARVEVHETGAYDFTDQNGYYEISLPPGTYTLTASYFTFDDQTYYNVQVASCEFTQRTFALQQTRPGPIPTGGPGLVL
jgi:hypothetical protein